MTNRSGLTSSKQLLALLLISLGSFILSACGRTAAPSPETAFRAVAAPTLSDDLNLKDLASGIASQRSALSRNPDSAMQFGPVSITRGKYVQALDRLSSELISSHSNSEKLEYIRNNFLFYEIYGAQDWGEILLTGYFEPLIRGSLRPTSALSQPIYRRPDDLVTIPLGAFSQHFKEESALKGRLAKGRVVPYYSREDIDGKYTLKGRGLEICWVDPIDAFFLQIQGSGTIELKDGSQFFVTYAEKNGHKYEAIGKFLKERIAPAAITMQSIVALLKTMPESERSELLFRNPSYVFFNRSPQRAITSLGIPATSGRTIAADPKFAPKGALAFITFNKPVFDTEAAPSDHSQSSIEVGSIEVGRFVLDQDSGGAITGTGRIDLFWGRGDDAKRYAGVLQSPARIWYLVPKGSIN